jgi:hypothetical protein
VYGHGYSYHADAVMYTGPRRPLEMLCENWVL